MKSVDQKMQHVISAERSLTKLSSLHLNLIGGSADLTASTKAKGADGHYDKTNRLGKKH
jgi:transketolase